MLDIRSPTHSILIGKLFTILTLAVLLTGCQKPSQISATPPPQEAQRQSWNYQEIEWTLPADQTKYGLHNVQVMLRVTGSHGWETNAVFSLAGLFSILDIYGWEPVWKSSGEDHFLLRKNAADTNGNFKLDVIINYSRYQVEHLQDLREEQAAKLNALRK